jgi:hypothetical protein
MGDDGLDHGHRVGCGGLAVDGRDQQRGDAEIGLCRAHAFEDSGQRAVIGQPGIADRGGGVPEEFGVADRPGGGIFEIFVGNLPQVVGFEQQIGFERAARAARRWGGCRGCRSRRCPRR